MMNVLQNESIWAEDQKCEMALAPLPLPVAGRPFQDDGTTNYTFKS